MDSMSSEIAGKIDFYIGQAEGLLAQVRQLRTRFKAPSVDVAKDLVGEVGGVLVRHCSTQLWLED